MLFFIIYFVAYYRYKGTVRGQRYGPGTGPIWLSDVRCVGNEQSIANCSHSGLGSTDCQHDEDVSLSCGSSPVQLGKTNVILLSFVHFTRIRARSGSL